jgi:hypothetical protein
MWKNLGAGCVVVFPCDELAEVQFSHLVIARHPSFISLIFRKILENHVLWLPRRHKFPFMTIDRALLALPSGIRRRLESRLSINRSLTYASDRIRSLRIVCLAPAKMVCRPELLPRCAAFDVAVEFSSFLVKSVISLTTKRGCQRTSFSMRNEESWLPLEEYLGSQINYHER